MKEGLTTAGKVVYGIVMTVGAVVDIAVMVLLFARGNVVLGIIYLVIGFTIVLTVFHWIGMLLAAPFVLAGRPKAEG